MVDFTLGTDAELFAKDLSNNHRSLCGLIGGTKEHPLPFDIEKLPEGFMYQEDNVAMEFNIPPCYDAYSWSASIALAMQESEKKLKEIGLTISTNCAVSFAKEELLHPQALVFGCEPDYNAWKLLENKKPYSTNPNLRTAGGHIHVGCSTVDMVKGVQNMDLFLGVPSVILDDSKESVMRRELYGKAGAMRPKPYGWEYRSLSNFWVFIPEFTSWIWNATQASLNFKHKFTKREETFITNCINTGNKEVAEQLIRKYGLVMP